jgi:hypothetical protein
MRIVPESNGLGDVVAKVAKATGAEAIAKAYEKKTGRDCGCKERREALNRIWPGRHKKK